MIDKIFLRRCAHLAQLADNRVRDNPRVGALLCYRNRIIGEGYHRQAGQAHAEVNCLTSVREADRKLIRESTLYVSLEPCCVHGRTSPCVSLILEYKIPKVVFGQYDPTDAPGRATAQLRAAGVEVVAYPDFLPTARVGVPRQVMIREGRPYITLKYATSDEGFLRPADRNQSYWITNPISRRLVHRWRTQTTAVIVGARTWLEDQPHLDTRFYPGPEPVAVVLDPREQISPPLREGVLKYNNGLDPTGLKETLADLLRQRLGYVTVEGGAAVLRAFIDAGLWDELHHFTGPVRFGSGLLTPPVPLTAVLDRRRTIGTDLLSSYRNGASL